MRGPALDDDAAAGANLFALFAARARETPEAPAVLGPEGTTNYGRLLARAEAVRGGLTARGVTDGAPVGVLMARRADLVAVLLGALGAGAAHVPLDPSDPPERLARLLAVAGAACTVGDGPLMAAAGVEGLEAEALLAAPPSDAPPAPGGARLAYLLFTSGTTGTPKAVEVEHANVVHLLRSARRLLGFTAADRYLATSTIAFDASVTELFLPLVTGAALVLRERDLVLEPARLAETVRETGATIVQTSPSVWAAVLEGAPDFPRLRVAITHGEAAPPALARRLLPVGEAVWNLYGPTETTVWAVGRRLTEADLAAGGVPIGEPLAHLTARLVDEAGREVEGEGRGELTLSGPSVARGYRGAGPEDAARFVVSEGGRAYRTGDLVRRDGAGVLHHLGRVDDQMQIRGVRVEPAEIEAAVLAADPRVERAVAFARPGPDGGQAVAVAAVLRPGAATTAADLHAALEGRLPRALRPSRILLPERLPLLANGKIDRAALRAAAEAPEAGAAPPEHATRTERRLARLWAEVLGVPPPGREAQFFAAGGDSLTAVHMAMEVEREFGVPLPTRLVYDHPALHDLARRIEAAEAGDRARDDRGLMFHLTGPREGRAVFFCRGDLGLARRSVWRPDYPVHGLTFWAKGRGFVPGGSVEAEAEACLAEIRAVQPEGPWRIAGYSLGGLIAFELARRIEAEGGEVELLFLLDPSPPRHVAGKGAIPGVAPPPEPGLAGRLRARARRIAGGPGRAGWADWLSAAAPLPARWSARLRRALAHQRLRRPGWPWGMPSQDEIWWAYAGIMHPAARRYAARPVRARAVVAHCEGHERLAGAYAEVLPGLARLEPLPGGHLDLFDDPALTAWTSLLDGLVADAAPAEGAAAGG